MTTDDARKAAEAAYMDLMAKAVDHATAEDETHDLGRIAQALTDYADQLVKAEREAVAKLARDMADVPSCTPDDISGTLTERAQVDASTPKCHAAPPAWTWDIVMYGGTGIETRITGEHRGHLLKRRVFKFGGKTWAVGYSAILGDGDHIADGPVPAPFEVEEKASTKWVAK